MIAKLTMRPDGFAEPTVRSTDGSPHVWKYIVDGSFPPGEQIWVIENGDTKRWQIRRGKDGLFGDYNSAEDALAALQMESEK
jgi:hypothetical protein